MSMFGKSPSIGRRVGRQAQIVPGSNFTPGQFAAPMPQPKQRPMVTANPSFAVNEPVQVKRPANAQLGSSTPMSTQQSFSSRDISAAVNGGNQKQIDQAVLDAAMNPPQQSTPQTPTEPMPDPVTPVQPPPLKTPSLPEAMAAKAASGALTIQDVLAARQSGDDILAESILQALAGNGWNYARPNRAPVDPGFVPPAASWYDRSGAGPGMGAATDLASQMAVKAQVGTLTAVDALAAEQAGNPALATAIRNAVAGMGWNYSPQMNDDQTRPAQAQQPPRRYRTFAPGAAGGIYPG